MTDEFHATGGVGNSGYIETNEGGVLSVAEEWKSTSTAISPDILVKVVAKGGVGYDNVELRAGGAKGGDGSSGSGAANGKTGAGDQTGSKGTKGDKGSATVYKPVKLVQR